MIAGARLDEEPENVFRVSSRINSTWGGNLVDMVRCQRYLEIIDEEKLTQNAATVGAHLLRGLHALANEFSDRISNVRGKGLMCAMDLPNGETRDRVRDRMFEEGAIILGCGTHSLRFRPPLDITAAEVDEALDLVRKALKSAAPRAA